MSKTKNEATLLAVKQDWKPRQDYNKKMEKISESQWLGIIYHQLIEFEKKVESKNL